MYGPQRKTFLTRSRKLHGMQDSARGAYLRSHTASALQVCMPGVALSNLLRVCGCRKSSPIDAEGRGWAGLLSQPDGLAGRSAKPDPLVLPIILYTNLKFSRKNNLIHGWAEDSEPTSPESTADQGDSGDILGQVVC